jgi:hypothetical protein
MVKIRGPFASICCDNCGRWIEYSLGGTKFADNRMNEIRDLPRWYCAPCDGFPFERKEEWRATYRP